MDEAEGGLERHGGGLREHRRVQPEVGVVRRDAAQAAHDLEAHHAGRLGKEVAQQHRRGRGGREPAGRAGQVEADLVRQVPVPERLVEEAQGLVPVLEEGGAGRGPGGPDTQHRQQRGEETGALHRRHGIRGEGLDLRGGVLGEVEQGLFEDGRGPAPDGPGQGGLGLGRRGSQAVQRRLHPVHDPTARDEADDGGGLHEGARIHRRLPEQGMIRHRRRPGTERRRAHLGVGVLEEAVRHGHEVGAARGLEQLQGAQQHRPRRVVEDEGRDEPAPSFGGEQVHGPHDFRIVAAVEGSDERL